MVAVRRAHGLTDDLGRLASALESLDLRGASRFDESLTIMRDRLSRVIRSYLLPRIENPEAPLLVVVAGPTGSGKSTLVNSLAGLDLSDTGPLRPTTTVPLVLARIGRHEQGMRVGNVDCEVRVGDAPILSQMSLVDTPDLDSTAVGHRAVAENLVDHADIVVFVSSSLRYADNVPWEVLRRALSRGTAVIPVLNRMAPGGEAAVLDFKAMLANAGIEEDPVRVPEHHLGPSAQQIPSLAVRELRKRLYTVMSDRETYQRGVVNRVVNVTTEQTRDLIARVDEVARRLDGLSAELRSVTAKAGVLGEEPRPWIDPALPPMPSQAWRMRLWRRRAEPSAADLGIWLRTVRNGLVAEMTTCARRAVAESKTNPMAVTGISPLLEEAIDGWLAVVREDVAGDSHPRLEMTVRVAAAFDPDSELAAVDRELLQARLDVVFAHLAERLAELAGVGEPDTKYLTRRLEAVVRSYQFADA